MRPARSLIALLLPLLAAATSAAAQDVAESVERFADYWARGDAHAIAKLAAREGVSLDIDGEPMGPLGERQVAAVLRKVFDDRETLQVRTMGARVVGGTPTRASGELTWTMRARGTTIPERTTVFIAFVLKDGRWQITQIRFVQP